MAKTDRFMIAPINSGLQRNTTPFMIPDDAFESMENAYVFRGRVRKRFGARLMNQVPVFTGTRKTENILVNAGPVPPTVIVVKPFPEIDCHLTKIPEGK